MKFKKRRLWVVGLLVLASISGCASPTPVRHHPEFANVAHRIKTIAILAPEVEHLLITFSGDNARQPERERSVVRELNNRLRTQLESKQYTVRPIDEEWPGDVKKDESDELRQLRAASNAVIKQLYDEEATTEQTAMLRPTVGPLANPVAEQLHADALLLVNYVGYEKSKGQRAKDFTASILYGTLIGVASGGLVIPINTSGSSGGVIQLTLVDGNSGDILWTNRLSGPTDRKRGAAASKGFYGSADMVQKAIAPLPIRAIEE